MKKSIMWKAIGLTCLAFMMALAPACTKSQNDDDIIIALATACVGDIGGFARNSSPSMVQSSRHDAAASSGPCYPMRIQQAINGPASNIVDSRAGHGWYTGNIDINIKENCYFYGSMDCTFDCTLGAKMTDGTNLGGTLHINMTCNGDETYLNMIVTIQSLTFTVNNRGHNIFLTCTSQSATGRVTVVGTIDGRSVGPFVNNY